MPSLDVAALVLAGGFGTRLAPLTHTLPKVLVPVLGRPFLEHVLEEYQRQGLRRFVLSVGHLAEQVEAHFGDGSRFGCELSYVREREPLGTGGAIRHALDHALDCLSEPFLVLNGDTLLEVDLAALLAHHARAGEPVTLTLVHVADRARYGAVQVEAGRVMHFAEKATSSGPGLINGGLYVMQRTLFDQAPRGPFSLERGLLPQVVGHIAAFETSGFFVDMGTHEALQGIDAAMTAYRHRHAS